MVFEVLVEQQGSKGCVCQCSCSATPGWSKVFEYMLVRFESNKSEPALLLYLLVCVLCFPHWFTYCFAFVCLLCFVYWFAYCLAYCAMLTDLLIVLLAVFYLLIHLF